MKAIIDINGRCGGDKGRFVISWTAGNGMMRAFKEVKLISNALWYKEARDGPR
jgi:hypothetical protein